MTTTSSRRALALALALSIAVPTTFVLPVRAAPTAADLESARQLFKEGKDLRDAGDLAGAVAKLKAAHALGQTPITGLELGKTHVMRGELVEAREVFLGVARIPVASDETKKSADARVECDKLAGDLKARIPKLKVVVEGAPPGAKLKVTVDGELIPAAALSEPRSVNPGQHVVIAKIVGGPESRTDVVLKESESKSVSITVEAPAVVPPKEEPTVQEPPAPPPKKKKKAEAEPEPEPAPPPIVAPPPSSSSGGTSPLVYVGFVTAGVGLIAGSVTGVLALSKANEVKEVCPNSVCSSANKAVLDETKTFATVSTVAFGVAGAGLILGIIGLTKGGGPSEPTHAHVRPFIGLGSVGLSGAF
ncbi:MAG: hypothetical protein HYV09_33665 [Deltaproteobacteria bacterium]|nr:hypothetical protein [Deltaproteobacteria bacterium]